MPTDSTPLSDAERAELEQLRAEKQAREEAEQARRERAELERLRMERDVRQSGQAHTAPARKTSIMDPGDDLSMPLGQKIVLIGVAVVVVAIIVVLIFGPRS